MKPFRVLSLAVALAFTASASSALAQGLRKKITYTINVAQALRMNDYVLPPGKYILFQSDLDHINTFHLHPKDLTHEPIAVLKTTRVRFQPGDYPDKAQIKLEIDESSKDVHPVLRGWSVPTTDGYRIVAVEVKDEKLLPPVAKH